MYLFIYLFIYLLFIYLYILMGENVSSTFWRKLVDEDNDVYDDDDGGDDNDDRNDKTVEERYVYMRRQWIGKTTMVAKTDNDDTSIYDTGSVCGGGMT